ncbi:hypothetical protein LCGC14_2814230 [marine sediment metagenome]|uniref:Uncharacterized protein n=1 Tax=marine sediment metagenome TaxID=412755 RepID=A0A0F9BAD3_9ZZZZ
MAETMPNCDLRAGHSYLEAAVLLLQALEAKRITLTTMHASPELFTRFQAHTRFLGSQPPAYGYEYWYNHAIDHAVRMDKWPVKLIEKTISIDGHDITVDVQVPQSSHQATNAQLLCAYEVIEDGAKEHSIILPEGDDEW